MPPKKKQKLSAGDAAPSQTESTQPTPSQPTLAPKPEIDLNNSWTDEQETALLKAIVRWKPVGMHKHFRMLAIHDYMKSQGYAPPTEEHTRIPGIWKKLRTLYNLEGLDEREEPLVEDPSDEPYCPFQLPEDEYGEMMFERRLNPDGSVSPPASVRGTSARPSTVADTDEPRSSPAPSTRGGRRGGRTTRSTRGGRGTHLQVEDGGRKSRSSSRARPNEGQDEGEEEGDEDTTDVGKEESDAEAPAPRSTRTQTTRGKSKRGRGGRRGRGRRGQ